MSLVRWASHFGSEPQLESFSITPASTAKPVIAANVNMSQRNHLGPRLADWTIAAAPNAEVALLPKLGEFRSCSDAIVAPSLLLI